MPLYLNAVTPQILWANLPTASLNTNKVFLVTDIGRGGSLWRSNGARWMPVGGSVVIAESGVASSVTGTIATTTLASITIPAALMGAEGQLRITTLWSVNANSANTKTGFIIFGATTFASIILTSLLTGQCQHIIRNRGISNTQVGFVSGGSAIYTTSTSALVTATETTTVDKTLLIQGRTLTSAADTVTLESYTVELLQ